MNESDDESSSSTGDRLAQVRSELNKKLGHLPQNMSEKISDPMISSDAVACSLRDLWPASVPVQHFFKLSDESPVYNRSRCMPQKHNDVVKN